MFMKRHTTQIVALLVVAMVTMSSTVVWASRMPHYGQYLEIQEIVGNTDSQANKTTAVAKLIAVVQSASKDVHSRRFAAWKLGELGAAEAEDILRELAEKLHWADATRQFKWAAFLACWRIRVATQPTEEQQVALLVEALHERLQGVIASNVQMWAANELSTRGIQEALPAITKSIRYRDPTPRGEEYVWLHRTKINLLRTSPSRFQGLCRALATDDLTQRQRLRKWAIDELGKLGTAKARSALIGYAVALQQVYYDAQGKRDGFGGYATGFYRRIVHILRGDGMTESEIRQAGLQPDRFFVVAP